MVEGWAILAAITVRAELRRTLPNIPGLE